MNMDRKVSVALVMLEQLSHFKVNINCQEFHLVLAPGAGRPDPDSRR
jgi:hypothetical protein